MAMHTVRCENCGRLNRIPAAADGRLRCGNCQAYLPWIADAGDEAITRIPAPAESGGNP
jgi:thioredoxin 2